MSASNVSYVQEPSFINAVKAIRKQVRNPIDTWPEDVYHRDLTVARVLGMTKIFVADPDLVQQVLVDDADSYYKPEWMRRVMEPVFGQGILTTEDALWRSQRRVAAPVFRPSNVNGFVPAMIGVARKLLAAWSALPNGSELEISHEMMSVTFDIILETMLSGRGDIDAARFEESMRIFLELTSWPVALTLLGAPRWTPFPGKAAADRAHRHLQAVVGTRVAERRASGERRDDLLSLMLDAKDPETGEGLTDTSIRDNILTFIAAGHETTALVLTWTFFLLDEHPGIKRHVLAEIARVTEGKPLEAAQVAELTYTRQVVQESMRVYPPVALIGRQPNRPTRIGDFGVKPGDNIHIPIYAIHHRAKVWDKPHVFDPDRFTPEAVKERHRWSYLPFGAGPRICMGMGFAFLEVVAVLGTLLPTVDLRCAKDLKPTPKLRLTLHPAEGMPMRMHARAEE